MEYNPTMKLITRRDLLRAAAAFAGGALASRFYPATLVRAATVAYPQQVTPADAVAAMREKFGSAPIQPQKLAENITLLSGPGGNVVVLDGADGKLMVDTFVSPAWPHLKDALDTIGKAPVKTVIDTHWHFDHTDNNAHLRAAGATVLAHVNTKKRMSETHTLPVLNLTFPPSPADALPQQVFSGSRKLQVNGETLALAHVPPAHTDTDIHVHFQKANVLHTGDIVFNGMYPYIDSGTGGNITGVIAACGKILALVDDQTKIVPGHGPLGTKADVAKYRDMLTTTRDRVQKLKSSGKSMEEAVAAKPFADLDAVWGKALFNGDAFVQIVYLSL